MVLDGNLQERKKNQKTFMGNFLKIKSLLKNNF